MALGKTGEKKLRAAERKLTEARQNTLAMDGRLLKRAMKEYRYQRSVVIRLARVKGLPEYALEDEARREGMSI